MSHWLIDFVIAFSLLVPVRAQEVAPYAIDIPPWFANTFLDITACRRALRVRLTPNRGRHLLVELRHVGGRPGKHAPTPLRERLINLGRART